MNYFIKRKNTILAVVLILLYGIISGCNRNVATNAGDDSKPFTISIMASSSSADPIKETSPVLMEIEKLTNTKLDIRWVPSASYNEKVNTSIASQNIPMIMYASKSPSIESSAKAGAFWEINDYIKDYPYLSQVNPQTFKATSIQGKNYGIPSQRAYTRYGFFYRKDWLDNVGMESIATIDDFYEMLKRFTNDDPDKNGNKDTYGLSLSKFEGSFRIMLTWFGGGNEWEASADGSLIPVHYTQAYKDCMNFMKKLYNEGLINKDFAIVDAAEMETPFTNGKAGTIVNMPSNGARLFESLTKINPEAQIAVQASVEGPKGIKNLPSTSFGSIAFLAKQPIPTENELKKVLTFMDSINSGEIQKLMTHGIKGVHYELIEDPDGVYAQKIESSPKNDLNDLNVIGLWIPKNDYYMTRKSTPLEKEVLAQAELSKDICVFNPAEGITTNTFSMKGQQLRNIIEDAKLKYIIGEIDEKGFDDAVELWKKSGGEDLINEINEEYKKAG